MNEIVLLDSGYMYMHYIYFWMLQAQLQTKKKEKSTLMYKSLIWHLQQMFNLNTYCACVCRTHMKYQSLLIYSPSKTLVLFPFLFSFVQLLIHEIHWDFILLLMSAIDWVTFTICFVYSFYIFSTWYQIY